MQIRAVRAGLAAAADVIEGLTCTAFVPDAPTVPHFFPADTTVDFDATFGRGLDSLTVTCMVLVSRADDEAGQDLLDDLISGAGPASIKAALEAARGGPGEAALGGACDDFRVTRVQGYRTYNHAGTTYLGAQVSVTVYGRGDL